MTITDQQLAEWRDASATEWGRADVGGYTPSRLLPALAAVPQLIDALIAERARSRALHEALRSLVIVPHGDVWECNWCRATSRHRSGCIAAPAEEVAT